VAPKPGQARLAFVFGKESRIYDFVSLVVLFVGIRFIALIVLSI